MRLIEHIKGNVKFQYYRDGNLYYQTEAGMLFPVPVADTNTATFLVEDKASLFMRWIRKHLDSITSGAV